MVSFYFSAIFLSSWRKKTILYNSLWHIKNPNCVANEISYHQDTSVLYASQKNCFLSIVIKEVLIIWNILFTKIAVKIWGKCLQKLLTKKYRLEDVIPSKWSFFEAVALEAVFWDGDHLDLFHSPRLNVKRTWEMDRNAFSTGLPSLLEVWMQQ